MKKLSIFSVAVALLFASCTKDMSSTLNRDPKKSATGIGTALFLQGELNLVNTINTTSVSIAPFRVVSQVWTENTYTYEANYNFSQYNSPGNFWNNLFVNTVHNLRLAKQSFPTNFFGTPGQLRNDYVISDILEIYAVYMATATYGNIPYSQAESDSIPFPKYDDAKTVYASLLTRIDTCIAGLNTSEEAMGDADQIYGGDVTQWKKFAASLKLKMAMLNANNDPATTATKVKEAIATGVFTSNDDNALFTYDQSSPANSNPIWNALSLSGRHDFIPANMLVDTMVQWSDPRLPFYITQFNGGYSGGKPGAANGYGKFSDFCCALSSSTFYSPSLPGDILDYSQVEFYLTEAAARGFITDAPATHYANAVTASIEFWGGSASDATTYLAQPDVAYDAANWQPQVATQEWIANFNHNWDSWTDIRRLGYPDLNTVNPPIAAKTKFPLRLTYPPNEKTSNSANTAAAIAALPGGQDIVTAKLFWEP
jgi:hypothetical protein